MVKDQNKMPVSTKIVVLGATGFTGRLVSASLVARGIKPVLAGRDSNKLEVLAKSLGGLETATADIRNHDSVADLVESGDILITTVGPFTLYGEAALEASLKKGAHYIDSTGEPGFIRKVFEDYGPRAKDSGIAMITASGYDYVPGNCAAASLLEESGSEAVRVDVGYFTKGGFDMSEGTKASTRVASIYPGMMWESGRLVERYTGLKLRDFDISGRSKPGLSISSSEHYSLPRVYSNLADINVYLGLFGKQSYTINKAARGLAMMMKIPGIKSILRKAASLSKSKGKGPDESLRASSQSLIIAETFDKDDALILQAVMVGANGYDFTADMIAWNAESISKGKLKSFGAVGPVEAFGIEELIDGCKQAGLGISIK